MNLSRAFASEEYERQRREMFEKGQQEAQALMEEAQKKAEEAGFLLRFQPTGITLIPMAAGKPMTPEQFAALTADERRRITESEGPVDALVAEAAEHLRAIERQVVESVRLLDRQVAEAIVKGPFDLLDAHYNNHSEVGEFLKRLREFTLAGADFLRQARLAARSRAAAHRGGAAARRGLAPVGPTRRLPLQRLRGQLRYPRAADHRRGQSQSGLTSSDASNAAPTWAPISAITRC